MKKSALITRFYEVSDSSAAQVFAEELRKSEEDGLRIVIDSKKASIRDLLAKSPIEDSVVYTIDFQHPEESEQYGFLMDTFALMDQCGAHRLASMVLESFLVNMGTSCPINDFYFMLDMIEEVFSAFYLDGDCDCVRFFKQVIDLFEAKKIGSEIIEDFMYLTEVFEPILSGYDFSFETLAGQHAILLIRPPGEWKQCMGNMLLSLILCFFRMFAEKAGYGQVFVFDAADIPNMPGGEVPLMKNFLSHEEYCRFLIQTDAETERMARETSRKIISFLKELGHFECALM